MSSDLLSTLELLQLNNYGCIVIVTVVAYDYFLTFSREVDYIWSRRWTWVSTLFVLVRYLGLSYAVLGAFDGSTFVPGPLRVSVSFDYLATISMRRGCSKGTVMFLLTLWEFPAFRSAADFVMILRVYAMWNRSKKILWALLFVYVPAIILAFAFAAIYDAPSTSPSVTIVQIADFSFCSFTNSKISSQLDMYGKIPQFILGTMLLVLAVTQTLKQSIAMYKATRQWQLNRYMQQLVRDGVLYFLVNLFTHVVSVILDGVTINSTSLLFLTMLAYISIFPIMPRFIIGVRELYDRDLRGRRQDVDTGFGMLSQSAASQNEAMSTIAFADVPPAQGQSMEGDADELEEIRLEALEDHTRHVFG